MIALILSATAAVFALVGVAFGLLAIQRAHEAVEYCAQNNKKARQVALEAEMTEISDSLQSVRESLHKLRSRNSMRERRAKEKNGDARPEHDLQTQEGRDAARLELEAELAQSGRLNPRIHQQRGN